jgi:hypothetical protein
MDVDENYDDDGEDEKMGSVGAETPVRETKVEA